MVRNVLHAGIKILKQTEFEAPVSRAREEAGVILCHVLNCDKTYLYTHWEDRIEEKKQKEYLSKITMRAEGMPLQYITGHQEFMSLDFVVSPDVLIPRQDTEVLVESVMNYAKNRQGEDIKILDMCTGSGCIAISLALYIKGSKLLAADISEKALEIARINASNNKAERNIVFLQSDIFENCSKIEKNSFDIIVSNPPYIDANEMKVLQREVRDFEPISALYGGEDGLDFYRKIIEGAKDFLKSDGILAFEVGYKQAKEVVSLMKDGYGDIQIIKDLSQIERVIISKRDKKSDCI